MHVLHIEKMLFAISGVTSYVQTLSQLQRRRGHQVSFFSCARPGSPDGQPRFVDFTATRNPFQAVRMVHNFEAANLLAHFLYGKKVDIAHLHNLYHHLTPSILPVLARHGAAIVMTVHDYRLACPSKHFLRGDGVCMRCLPNKFHHAASRRCEGWGGAALAVESLIQMFFRRYVRWIDLFLCPSPFMLDVLRRAGVPRSKLAVLPYPVIAPTLPADAPRGERRLLYLGRLSREKSPELMLDLAAALPQAEVVLVGGGPMLEELRLAARKRGLANVSLSGAVPHEQVGRYLASATAVVVPSRCLENSPQTMLEAMLAGRCVIVADYPTLRQWVVDGRTGRLFAAGSAASLASVASEVLADPATRATCESEARKLVAARHDGAVVAEKLDAFYEEARRRCALRW